MKTTTTCEFCGLEVDGHCEDCEVQCAHCNDWFPRESVRTSPEGKMCEYCFSDLCAYCDCCGDLHYIEDLNNTPACDGYCMNCFDSHCTTCRECGDTMWTTSSYQDPNGDDLCSGCFYVRCFECTGCSETFWLEDVVDCCDGNYCTGCAPDEDCYDSAEFVSDNRHNRMVSKRRYGVEIETHRCDDYRELGGNIYFEIKEDCSVRGKEFASVILAGDKGLEAIEDLCNFGEDHNWSVNSNCGLHIHLDMSKESNESLKSTAIAYLMTRDFWLNYVTEDRHYNSYCGENAFNVVQILGVTDFNWFASGQPRYEWFNVAAYTKYKTFEIRLHQGSINTDQICNWIRIHALFVDWAVSKTCAEVIAALEGADREDFMAQICRDAGCDDLVTYYHLTSIELVV